MRRVRERISRGLHGKGPPLLPLFTFFTKCWLNFSELFHFFEPPNYFHGVSGYLHFSNLSLNSTDRNGNDIESFFNEIEQAAKECLKRKEALKQQVS